MRELTVIITLIFSSFALGSFAQNITVDGVSLSNSGGTPSTCSTNGYKLKGTATSSGGCVSLTQSTFDAGGLWVCDPINLNQSFKVHFEANFDAFNSGDGIAFVLQTEGVPDVLGGEGGGLGYTFGNLTGCIPAGNCNIDPSVVIEFDIWNNAADFWDVSNPALGTINDIACDHATILVDGNQTSGGTLAGPSCLLPGGINVTDGQFHDVCIIWDVTNLEYSIYFDSALVTSYNGDIRTNFLNPASVSWGFTAGSGGANQNQRVCNVDMVTNPSNPSCTCSTPVASYAPVPASMCSGESIDIELFSTVPGTSFDWIATDNPNVIGETTTTQTNDSIQETLSNSSGVAQVVNYTVTPYVIGCATGTDIIVPITVNATPTITGNSSLCEGSTTPLMGSGTPHPIFPWFSSDASVATINSTGLVTGLSAGTTTITYLDDNDCLITTTITVTPSPSSTITGANSYCAGTFTTLSTLTPFASYSWSTGALTPTIDATIADNPITVAVTDALGCSGTSSFFIVNETNAAVYDTTLTICDGDAATIHGNVEGTAGVYSQTFTLTSGCDSISTITLVVQPLPTVSAGSDFTVCEGESATLSGSGATSYTWNPSTIIDGQAFVPASTSTYTVTGIDQNGCINTSDVTITLEPSPIVSFSSDITSGCAPLTVMLINTTSGTLTNCVWTIDNGLTINGCGSVTTTFPNAGVYDITLETTSNNGCTSSETYVDYIYVEDINAAFTASSYEVTTSNQEIVFNNNSSQAVNYLWDFGDGSSTSTEENPSCFYNDSQGSYIIELIAYSGLGCTDTAYQTITVREEPIYYVPNTFTPDGDQFNQYFQPIFTAGFDPFDFDMYIYNRWGELIWESHDATEGWDGTSSSTANRLVQDGVYTWKIEFKAPDNDERFQLFGHVTMIR